MLAQKHRNIFVVGDMAQAIYSFRGADFRNILNFEKDYKDAKVYNLAQNYRSTKTIIEVAKNVIKKNSSHIPLDLWTQNSDGEKVKVYQLLNEVEEAMIVVEEIKNTIRSNSKSFSDFAVLYRTNAQSRNIEELFIKEGIPYKLVGGVRFYGRKEIRDLISYLKVIHNPKDSVAWERVINTPARGLGKKAVEKLKELNWDVVAISNLTHLPFEAWVKNNKTLTPLELLEEVLEKTKYVEWLDDKTDESLYRIENVKELKSVASLFSDLSEFLENVSLIESADRPKGENADAVTLMTVHASKGLEFPVLFIIGLEEGIFPHSRSYLELNELEEERRLCYVALTRAKEKLYLTCTKSRLYFGSVQSNIVSRFISEIPNEFLDTNFSTQAVPTRTDLELEKFLDKLQEDRFEA